MNELTITTTFAFNKGDYSQAFNGIFSLTVTGTEYIRNVQNIGISLEALDVGDFTTKGFMFAINRDATNYVELFPDSSGTTAFAKLKAGEPCLVRLGTSTPYAKADTAAINLEYLIIED
jgi:hypothetical protein